MTYPVNEKLKSLNAIFSRNGYNLFLVGGAVRDHLLKRENSDYDFTTDAKPDDIKRMFTHTIDTGIKHGTVTVLYKGGSYEITTFRLDGEYTDSRHPKNVYYTNSLSEDLKRRDFTINALAVDLSNGEIIDEHGGIKDLEEHTIRAIGNADERFSEDALRMLRAIRFLSKLDFSIDKNTSLSIKKLHKNILSVSKERIKEELFLLLSYPYASNGIKALSEYALLEDILPEVEKTRGVFNKEESVFEHTLKTLEYGEKRGYSPIIMVSLLLHDTGKKENPIEGTCHATLSSEIARDVLKRLKCSNDEINTVTTFIREHMISENISSGDIRRLINRVGVDNIDNFFLFLEADRLSKSKDSSSFFSFKKRVQEEVKSGNPMKLKDLKINGNDILSFTSGKNVGVILNTLLDDVLDNPELNNREALLERIKKLLL